MTIYCSLNAGLLAHHSSKLSQLFGISCDHSAYYAIDYSQQSQERQKERSICISTQLHQAGSDVQIITKYKIQSNDLPDVINCKSAPSNKSSTNQPWKYLLRHKMIFKRFVAERVVDKIVHSSLVSQDPHLQLQLNIFRNTDIGTIIQLRFCCDMINSDIPIFPCSSK